MTARPPHGPGRGPGLIVTADDFGLHPSVNEAVERAYRTGILTAASLMVGAPAARDAIGRAHSLRAPPGLRVGLHSGLRIGLHLVLADGPAVLPPRAIPDLVGADGRFGTRMVRDGIRFFCLPRVRRQLALEIRAQFEAFAASGLPLDHVNAHKHFHLHPTILSLILDIGRDFGLRAVRLPRETGPPGARALGLRPWLARLAACLDRAGVAHNDYIVGIRTSGHFDEPALMRALRELPPAGIGELYLHPALLSGAAIAPSMRAYRHADEFAALVAPRVRAACDALRAQGWRFGGYADLLAAPATTASKPVADTAAPTFSKAANATDAAPPATFASAGPAAPDAPARSTAPAASVASVASAAPVTPSAQPAGPGP